jgi:cyclic beta-1,2-glucan synthetase
MYQAAIQALLGLRRSGATISVSPCVPTAWPRYSLSWRVGRTRYDFTVSNPEHRCCGIASAELDGVPIDAGSIPLADDGDVHEVTIVLGASSGHAMPLHATTARTEGRHDPS